jgi:hypothetical protein
LDDTFIQTVEHHGRLFQHYAVTQGAYFAPIDEVCRMTSAGLKIDKTLTPSAVGDFQAGTDAQYLFHGL